MKSTKINKKYNDFLKSYNLNQKAFGAGVVFFVTFWIVLDSVLLGVMFGVIMYTAIKEDEKKKSKLSKKK
ncbi:MAG: hypothetical protein HRU03_07935 [Nanoarchaeales archaeon]|nr:hypothetical protein [Nanoarchaeales archaeon]